QEGDVVEQLDQLRKATGAKGMKVLKTEKSRFVSVNGKMQGTSTKEETVKDIKSDATLAKVKQSSQLEQRGPGERPHSVSKTQVDVPALGIRETKVDDSNALQPGESGHLTQKKGFNYPWVNDEPDRGDYTPTDLAEYILRTGDEEGVALAVEELLRQGMMTREEAIVYLQDVKAEMNYIRAQQEKLRRIQELREAINMKKKDESVFKHRANDVLGAKETVLPQNPRNSPKATAVNQQSLKPQKATLSKPTAAADRASSTAAPSLKNPAAGGEVVQGDAVKASDKKAMSGKLTPVDLERMTEQRVPPRSQPEADVVSILKKLKGATSLYDEYTLEEIIYWLAKDMFAHSIIKGDQSAEEALARFANFVESEVAQNKLSGEVEKKVLDIMLAALVDILRELPSSQYSGTGNQAPQRLFSENSERRPAKMPNSRPRSPSIRPREEKKKTVPVEKREELVPASQKS
ncbi:unnamed protein product, partial [Ixodes hexagonus]